jgi:ATP-binding protein involved in chromosome partitioning
VSTPAPDALKTALALVIDPELRRNVVELGMVDGVDVDGGRVHVTIRLTIPGCPLKSNLEAQVRMHVGAVPGVEAVTIGFTHMDEAQRAALRAQLQGGRAEGERTIAVEERTRVIAVASGKGGVGKSSLTVNLALALQARGLEVGVVDADIYGYSIPGMLGVQQRPVVVDKMIVPPVAHDLKVMSIGFFLDDGGSVVWRGPMLHRALEQFLSDVYWGPLDYLLIDMPPGTGDVGLSLGQLLPRAEAVLVTTPQLAAQRVAQRAAQMVEKLGQPLIGVIENMSSLACPCCGEATYPFGRGGGADLAAQLGVPLLGEVPLEPALREGSDSGEPVFISDPDDASSRAIAAIAQRIAATGPAPTGPVKISSPLAVLKG